MASVIAFVVAAFIPLVFLYGVRALDFFQTGSPRFIAISGAWGIIAYFLAARINPLLISRGIVETDTLVRFVAPVLEEILKGLVLLVLIQNVRFKYFLDGAVYGFAAGIGFAIFENFEYILGHPSIAVALAISRVLSTNLIHATGSALIGISLGRARFESSVLKRGLVLLVGLLVAIGIHVGFNNMVNEGVLLLFAFAAGFAGAGIITAFGITGLREEKVWIEKNLGMADGVTSKEAAIAPRFNKDDVLKLLAGRFGAEKAAQSEQFLLMQAQLGILRETLARYQKLGDQKRSLAVEKQMDELREEMNALRRNVGVYCMVYLRTIFPEDASPLWAQLQARLGATDKSLAGTGVWSTLGDRLKPQSASEEND